MSEKKSKLGGIVVALIATIAGIVAAVTLTSKPEAPQPVVQDIPAEQVIPQATPESAGSAPVLSTEGLPETAAPEGADQTPVTEPTQTETVPHGMQVVPATEGQAPATATQTPAPAEAAPAVAPAPTQH